MASKAGYLQTFVSQLISSNGEQVTITRAPTSQGGTTTTQTLWCLPQPVSSTQASRLQMEGVLNVSEGLPHQFVFDGISDIREGVDTIAYNGSNWKVLAAQPKRLEGRSAALHVLAVRQ